jgi:hypothetical protein
MATRSVITDDNATAVGHPPAVAGRILRYQLNVVASTTQHVVRAAGGWLCDRARAGWDVNVLVADSGDPGPLAILGASTHGMDDGSLSMVRSASRTGALAVSADLLAADSGLRDEVVQALKRGLPEVVVLGKHWPGELGRQADSVQHRVSSAARAFKSHALAAADLSTEAATATETLFRIEAGSFRPLYSV